MSATPRDFREGELTESRDRDEVKREQNPAGERERSSTGMSNGVRGDRNQLAPLWGSSCEATGSTDNSLPRLTSETLGFGRAPLGVAASMLFPTQRRTRQCPQGAMNF